MQFDSDLNKENSFTKVNRIKKYIDEHITEELTLAMLADEFEVSIHYLSHLFKKYTGDTVLRYINVRRLNLVRGYYASGMNLLDAALMAGFGYYSSFYRAYIKEFGVSPRKHQNLQNK